MAKYIIDTDNMDKIEKYLNENGQEYNEFKDIILDLFDNGLCDFEF